MKDPDNNGISMFHGNLIILRASIVGTPKESLTRLKDKIIDIDTSVYGVSDNTEVHLFVDLSAFNIVSSTIFGALGAVIQSESIRTVGLCGMKPMMRDTAKRLGIIPEENKRTEYSKSIDDNIHKMKVFDSLEAGLLSLISDAEIATNNE